MKNIVANSFKKIIRWLYLLLEKLLLHADYDWYLWQNPLYCLCQTHRRGAYEKSDVGGLWSIDPEQDWHDFATMYKKANEYKKGPDYAEL